MAEKKRQLLILRRTPYGSGLARASVDLALAMGAFEQDFDVLFIGEGVLQLVKTQDSDAIGLKNVSRALSSLPLVDIESVYVDANALARYGLTEEQLVLPVNSLASEELNALMCDCDHLLGF